jgi:hypothetical protein
MTGKPIEQHNFTLNFLQFRPDNGLDHIRWHQIPGGFVQFDLPADRGFKSNLSLQQISRFDDGNAAIDGQ